MKKIIQIVNALAIVIVCAPCMHADDEYTAALYEDKIVAEWEPVVEVTPVVQENNNAVVEYGVVEVKPKFPGGEAAMFKWLGENVVYPPQAAEENIMGKVIVSFIIEKDGSITNVKVVRGLHRALDAEAVRVAKKMPKWSPGCQNGVPVRVSYILPFTFKLG